MVREYLILMSQGKTLRVIGQVGWLCVVGHGYQTWVERERATATESKDYQLHQVHISNLDATLFYDLEKAGL